MIVLLVENPAEDIILKGGEKNVICPERERERPGSGGVCFDPCFGRYRCYCGPHAAWPNHRQRIQDPQQQPLQCQFLVYDSGKIEQPCLIRLGCIFLTCFLDGIIAIQKR